MPQANPAAARLTKALRDAMKLRGLGVPALADVIEQQTGVHPTDRLIYRATGDAESPMLIKVSPLLATIAHALDLDPVALVMDAVSPDLEPSPERGRP